jgi:hypothetical protein
MSLLTVTEEFKDLTELADQLLETEGELPPNLELLITQTLTKQAEMVTRYCQYLHKSRRDIEIVEAEIHVAKEWIEKQKRKQQRFEEFVSRILVGAGLRKLEGLYGHRFSLRHSESVEVTVPAEKLPRELTVTKLLPDKMAIKAALQSGMEVPGCAIKSKDNLNWK